MLSTRLGHLLEMRQLDPAGQPWPGEAYIFGDELGRLLALATIRDRWTALVARVGLAGLQLRDMRHEGANQYEETGTPVSDVSQLLGHTNIATTSAICETSGAAWRSSRSTASIMPGPRPRRLERCPSSAPARRARSARMGRRDRAHTDEGPTGRERRSNRGRSVDGNTTKCHISDVYRSGGNPRK